MKHSLYRIAAVAVEWFTALAACVGCSKPPTESPEPTKPAQIHWHGPATGYEAQVAQPTDATH